MTGHLSIYAVPSCVSVLASAASHCSMFARMINGNLLESSPVFLTVICVLCLKLWKLFFFSYASCDVILVSALELCVTNAGCSLFIIEFVCH